MKCVICGHENESGGRCTSCDWPLPSNKPITIESMKPTLKIGDQIDPKQVRRIKKPKFYKPFEWSFDKEKAIMTIKSKKKTFTYTGANAWEIEHQAKRVALANNTDMNSAILMYLVHMDILPKDGLF